MRSFTGGALLLLFLAARASAGTVITAPLAVAVGDQLACVLHNAGSKEIKDVLIEASDVTGVLATVGPVATVAPGKVAQVLYNAVGFTTKICKFSFKGSKKTSVASACVLPGGAASCSSIVAAR